MGYDEHGPAYPAHCPGTVKEFHDRIERRHLEAYRCPICSGDQNRFMTCEYPDCPDGCDQPGRFKTYPNTMSRHPLTTNTLRSLVGWAVAFALLAYILWPIK
jgi:hypothetical protein